MISKRMVVFMARNYISDIFYFFCSGEGKGVVRCARKGRVCRFSSENPRRGGASFRRRGGGAAGSVSAAFGGGGGLSIFFRARNPHQEVESILIERKCT